MRTAAAWAAFVLLVLGLAVAGAEAKRKPAWTWASLHRPWQLPRIGTGIGCPVSRSRRVDLGPAIDSGPLPGPGPAYPAGLAPDVAVEFVYPPDPRQTDFYGSGWGGNKVLWWVKWSYRGPVLIRGRRLDGPELVRFDRGVPPKTEIRIPAATRSQAPTRSRDRPGYTRLRAAGCYAYQIDGIGFSRTIVFQGRIVPAP
jgi:hypothetical protein